MPSNPSDFTLALILTAAGVTPASALVVGIVQLVKTLIPGGLSAYASRIAAFVLSAALVVFAYVGTSIEITAATVFAAFLAWYSIARMSLAVYDDVTQKPNSLTGPVTS